MKNIFFESVIFKIIILYAELFKVNGLMVK